MFEEKNSFVRNWHGPCPELTAFFVNVKNNICSASIGVCLAAHCGEATRHRNLSSNVWHARNLENRVSTRRSSTPVWAAVGEPMFSTQRLLSLLSRGSEVRRYCLWNVVEPWNPKAWFVDPWFRIPSPTCTKYFHTQFEIFMLSCFFLTFIFPTAFGK